MFNIFFTRIKKSAVMQLKIRPLFFAILLFFCGKAFALTEEELKEYKYINFYDYITSYNARNKNVVNGAFNDKKIDITSTASTTYLQPVQKFITFLEYRGASRKIDTYQKPFLLDWFKISNGSKSISDDDTAESILADENFGLFYTSTMYSTRGKNYFITTQKAVNDLMEKELKLGDVIKVYIWNLGQYSSNIPVFVIVGYEKSPTISQAIRDKMYFQQYLPTLKNDIFNRRFDKAKGNIEMLLKKYPNDLDLKLNLCLIFNQTNFFDKSIACYKEVLKADPRNYDAYYGISMAYYNNNKLNAKARANYVIENTNKAIELIQSVTTSPVGTLAMIAYNSYYLRAMAKIELKDKTAIHDLTIINQNQPTLVSKESIELFKKQLGID